MPLWVEVPASTSSSELSELELEPSLYGTRPLVALAIVEDRGSRCAFGFCGVCVFKFMYVVRRARAVCFFFKS